MFHESRPVFPKLRAADETSRTHVLESTIDLGFKIKFNLCCFTARDGSETVWSSRDRIAQLIPEIDFVFQFGIIEQGVNSLLTLRIQIVLQIDS